MAAASPAAGQTPNWPFERPPRPLPQRTVQFPPYEIRTLPNGMQVILVLHHEQPAVSMRLLVRAGTTHDPQGKVGVASMAASLLNMGTTTRSAAEIADSIDQIGAAIATGAGPDLTFINMVVMKDSFDFGMDMMADLARNPVFAQAEIDRQKQQILSTLQVSVQDPSYLADIVFDRLVYGFHPYGMPGSGTAESLSAITRQDLQAYHRAYFAPNNMVLAIVGDVTADEAFAGAQRAFGGWPRADVPPVQTIEPPPPTRRIVVIDKPDAVQTEIRAGQLTMPRKHDDYLAFDIAVKILGGEGGNRLHRVLRSERGLTYGAQADTQAWRSAGHFVAETNTRTETTGEALRLLIDELSRIQREPVSNRELLNAQEYQAGSFPLTIETPNDIATQVISVVINDLPIEDIGSFPQRVQAITQDDILRVARQYIRPDRLSTVLVGNAAAFVPQLQQVGFTDIEVIPAADLDVMSATLRRERRAAEVRLKPDTTNVGAARSVRLQPDEVARGAVRSVRLQADQAAARSVRLQPDLLAPTRLAFSGVPAAVQSNRAQDAMALLSRVIEARGGLQALKNVRTVVADADTSLRMEQGTLVTKTKTYVAYPDKFRVDATIEGIETVQVYNAGAAWVRNPAGVQDVPQGMRDEMMAGVARDMIPLLVNAAEGRLEVRALPDEVRDGQRLRVLEITGDELPPVKLFIDAQNMVTRQAYTAAGPDGRPEAAEEVFSDYRTVDGVQVPFKAELLRRGAVILSRTLTSVAFNQPIDDALFRRP